MYQTHWNVRIYGINQWPQMTAFWDLDCRQQDHLGVLLRLCWQPDMLNCLHRDYWPVIEKFPGLSRRFIEQKLPRDDNSQNNVWIISSAPSWCFWNLVTFNKSFAWGFIYPMNSTTSVCSFFVESWTFQWTNPSNSMVHVYAIIWIIIIYIYI